jgi:outer membrane receptor for ferrienterochelin and colicin
MKMKMVRAVCTIALALASAVVLEAQTTPTGTITGQVVDQGGLPMPGVTVAVTSPALQGTRSTTTTGSGAFILPFLPTGDYTVTFTLQGFQKVERKVRVAVTETVPVNAQMAVADVTETVTVTAEAPTDFTAAPTVASSYQSGMIDQLPVARTLQGATLLTPMAYTTGPGGNISISGSMSYESLFLVNGVVVNENLRGQARDLYIEDAILETKTSWASISAEYGHFSGGVINATTKSGSNDLHGSFRTTANNDHWRTLTPIEKKLSSDPRVDKTVPTYEATLGGPLLKDKLWFFGAGRLLDRQVSQTLAYSNLPYEVGTNQKRYEGKLTYSPVRDHTLKVAYSRIDQANHNDSFDVAMDPASLNDNTTKENLISANYTGILSPSFFFEAQYSRRQLSFIGVGSKYTDLVRGTLLQDLSRNNARWNSPTFCGICGPGGTPNEEKRDNQNVIVKGSYFLSTSGAGSHNLVFGTDVFDDMRQNNNYQSGSDYRISIDNTLIRGDQFYPVITGTSFIQYTPILQQTQGNRLRTYSVFLNDAWRLSNHLSFNLGVRWDKNDGEDQGHNKVANDQAFSPRLALSFDPEGNGDWTFNAGLARYVVSINSTLGDGGTAAGRQANFQYTYLGPKINATPGAALVPVDQALNTVFNWFFANGGTKRPLRSTPTYPGVNRKIIDGLTSPSTWEYTAGIAKRLGSRGLFRVDGIWRRYRDFYTDANNVSTGRVADPDGRLYDLRIITNTNVVERNYKGVVTQIQYSPTPHLSLNGNYALSNARGNFDGETLNSGAVASDVLSYPEYKNLSWAFPVGDLNVDQKHKARFWVTYDFSLSKAGRLSIGGIERFNSGQAFSSDGTVDTRPYVTNPGYLQPPASEPYFFGGRGNFHTDSMTATDLSLNYALPVGFKKSELFARVIVNNVFDESAQIESGDETVFSNVNDKTLATFNPFTTTPVEGVNFRLGPQFGKAIAARNYQDPRSFQFALGFRF